MPYQQKEVLKPVFVMDPAYEDISFDEEFNDEIPVNSQSVTNMCEDIASDDEFNLMDEMDYCMDSEFHSFINETADEIQCILDDIIATNPGLMEEDHPVVAATEEEEDDKEEEAVQHDDDDDKEEEEAVQYDDNDHLINTETTTICLCLTRTVKTFKNGRTEETRNTSISHSENVNLNEVDLGAVTSDILNEVPIQFSWPSVRVTKTL